MCTCRYVVLECGACVYMCLGVSKCHRGIDLKWVWYDVCAEAAACFGGTNER